MILEGAQAALALAPIAFAGGFIQGITGFGSALITIPLATFFVPLPFALAVFAVVDFANGLRLGLEYPRNAVLGDIARMVPLMVVGIVTGTTLLVNLPRNASLVALGTFVLGYAIYSLSRRGPPAAVSRNWAFLAGFCGGLSGTLFGAGGAPLAARRPPGSAPPCPAAAPPGSAPRVPATSLRGGPATPRHRPPPPAPPPRNRPRPAAAPPRTSRRARGGGGAGGAGNPPLGGAGGGEIDP